MTADLDQGRDQDRDEDPEVDQREEGPKVVQDPEAVTVAPRRRKIS